MIPPYTIIPALYKRPGERPPAWSCQCRRPDVRPLLRNHRHRSPWECLTADDVAAFVAAHPEAPPRKHFAWLEREFARATGERRE